MTNKRHNPNDKRPRPHAIAPREHYTYKSKTNSYKPKMSFSNEAAATNWVNSHFKNSENVVIYRCSICNQYHLHIKHEEE